MKEVLTRRFEHGLRKGRRKGDGRIYPYSDLILIDGGKDR